jgi:DNA-binding response OmpR family regulator
VGFVPLGLKPARVSKKGRDGLESVLTMNKGLYESAQAIVYDPVVSNRTATRASLHAIGFRTVELSPSLEMLTESLKVKEPDLLVVEVSGAEAELCELMQSVRQGTLGKNPFIVMIATTWRRDGTIVGKVINSGADDLVARPFSTSVLGERIRAQVERRKGFVVTSDYIGPDRRRDPNRPGVESVDVPNSLKVRTDGLGDEEAALYIARLVEKAKEVLNAQKVRRDAVQLCVQWRFLEQRNFGMRDFYDILTRLAKIASEIKRRIGGDKAQAEAAGQLLDSIASSLQVIMATNSRVEGGTGGPTPDFGPALSQLGHAALSLGTMFAPDETTPTKLAEIEATIARKQANAA